MYVQQSNSYQSFNESIDKIKELYESKLVTYTETIAKLENEIIKTLYYDIKPMTPEDAMLKLQERVENRFLAFVNIETSKVNVIYRLKDNSNYGLIEPEA